MADSVSELETFLRDREVTALTRVPRATRYEMIRAGTFPRGIRLSPRIVVWSSREIAAWQAERIAARDASAQKE